VTLPDLRLTHQSAEFFLSDFQTFSAFSSQNPAARVSVDPLSAVTWSGRKQCGDAVTPVNFCSVFLRRHSKMNSVLLLEACAGHSHWSSDGHRSPSLSPLADDGRMSTLEDVGLRPHGLG